MLTAEEEEAVQRRTRAMANRLNINNNEITTDEFILNIRTTLEENRRPDAAIPLFHMSFGQFESINHLITAVFDKGGVTSMLGTCQTYCGLN